MLAEEARLLSDQSKKGKAAFSKWRMAHAHAHHNIQPGKYGEPMLWHHFWQVLLDALHLAELKFAQDTLEALHSFQCLG